VLKGTLSGKPLQICALDYRILFEERKPYSWFVKMVPKLLTSMRFERQMISALAWRPGAEEWLKKNWERYQLAVISVGVPMLSRPIDMIIGDYTSDGFHFDDVYEFRRFLNVHRGLYRVYTNDATMLGLDEVTQPFKGWEVKL
jgi:hypothetical protein